jgi:hypothetical protein
MTLQDTFPGLKNQPGLAIALAPIDSFLGVSGAADGANLSASEAEYAKLYSQIRAIDPTFRDDELQPLSAMTWQGRNNVINSLRMKRAAAYYRVRGNIGPLQVETLRFVQDAVEKGRELIAAMEDVIEATRSTS